MRGAGLVEATAATRSLATIAPRLDRLVAGIRDRGCDAALLIGPTHAAHILAYQRVWSGPIAVIVAADGEITMLAPVYEVDAARGQCPTATVIGYGEPGFGLDLSSVQKMIPVAAGKLGRGRLATASDLPGLAEAVAAEAGVEQVPIDDLIHDVRLIKDLDELHRIGRSFELSLVAQSAVEAGARPGAAEIELYSAAQSAAQVEAGEAVDFGSDMLVGARTAEVCGPVAVPGRQRAEQGDVIVADIALRYQGYWGDTARTFIVGDNDEAAEVRASISEVLDDAAEHLRPGVRGCDVFARIASEIARRHPGSTFPHHGGHGLGVTGFEDPHLIPADTTVLEEGMVVAVEPGAYFAGRFGVREENNYVVTADGGLDLRTILASER
jgi:Xaa-Pro aminopeptidase